MSNMEKSRLAVIIESVIDGTIGIEQVWQSYGNMIRGTETTNSEEEALALTGLYIRYGAYLEKSGYLRDAKSYYEDGLNILRLRKVSFDPVDVDALRLVVAETWGGGKAHVFAFDAR